MCELRELPLVECIEWISQELRFEGDYSFAYGIKGDWEYLTFSTKDYFVDTKIIMKLVKTTGMDLIRITSFNGLAELWFGRPREKHKLVV